MKKYLSFCIVLFFTNFTINAQDLPTNPDPGKCYVKCITKDSFKEVTETVEVSPEYSTIEVIPATYKIVEEKVLVKEASKKLVYVPAVYETVEVSYVSKEGRNDIEVIPASFGNDSKTFETYPKTSGWEYKVLEDCPSVNKEACVAACFVEYPAQFEDVQQVTLAADASTNNIPVAQEMATYQKRVVKTPARIDEVEIPAEYATIKKRVVDTPAKTVTKTIPAKTQTVTRTVLDVKGGISSWEAVDCKLLSPTVLPIFYELGSARLTSASKKTIDETLLPLLKDSNVSIEIMSHTDSRGDDSFNLALSNERAKSVVNYLVSKGISRSRLVSRGFGETKLINKCSNGVECSEVEHQRNRRTEFRILGNN
ncbi:MAG: OmpA family protein [Chitinophagales bacterium]